jgi:hypothetical protein
MMKKEKINSKNEKKIRNDIFPFADKTSRPYIIDERIKIIQSIFSSTFSNEIEVIKFINDLSDPKDAELLIEISAYLFVLKENATESFKPIRLIGLFSIFEKISGPEWQAYSNWINKKDNHELEKTINEFKESENLDYLYLIKDAYDKYNENYGAIKRVKNFVNDYLETKTKLNLISALRTLKTNYVYYYSKETCPEFNVKDIEELEQYGFHGGISLMPKCYNWKECYITSYGCEIEKCPLNKNDAKFNEQFNKAISILYTFRCNFVHGASIPPVQQGSILGVYNGKHIFIDLHFDRFWQDCLKGIIKFFNTKLK